MGYPIFGTHDYIGYHEKSFRIVKITGTSVCRWIQTNCKWNRFVGVEKIVHRWIDAIDKCKSTIRIFTRRIISNIHSQLMSWTERKLRATNEILQILLSAVTQYFVRWISNVGRVIQTTIRTMSLRTHPIYRDKSSAVCRKIYNELAFFWDIFNGDRKFYELLSELLKVPALAKAFVRIAVSSVYLKRFSAVFQLRFRFIYRRWSSFIIHTGHWNVRPNYMAIKWLKTPVWHAYISFRKSQKAIPLVFFDRSQVYDAMCTPLVERQHNVRCRYLLCVRMGLLHRTLGWPTF